jgi:NADH-quinone oxidoreductase subunit J
MFDQILFLTSAFLTVVGAFSVAMAKNLMHACLYLLASLYGVAGLYATLGADFLAATQLVVYAGGVVILMLFAIMLTGGSENRENLFGITKIAGMGNWKTWSVGAFSIIVVFMVIAKIFAGVKSLDHGTAAKFTDSTVEEIGTLLLTDHILAFEISSILLLGALVGAAVISRPRRLNK